ncbi:sensor histidine kinase [Actinomadura parmotrematis]|uniref:histidine kinase n=1 Tax=Actinomadura parmotrematis TaxID=2864039 RepID=A0ABS7FWN2_9ACTN|nr:sensor histidine kinase [Actinomadura parmotrematis]MBW8484836.1 sensor histidine kinase [Actinomadura parmotrematis]
MSAGGGGWRATAGLVWRPLVAAAVTGTADPLPEPRPWPAGLRWAARGWVGRVPYGLVVNLAGLLLAVGMVASSRSLLMTETAARGLDVSAGTLLFVSVAVCLPFALRDRHPLGAMRVSFVAMATVDVSGWLSVPYVPAGTFAAILCLATVGVRCSREITLGVGVWCVAGVWVQAPGFAGGATVVVLLSLLTGTVVRLRRASRDELAEQERRHREEAAVLTERQRIARELHDVVAHHMSMIAIQAEAAPYKAAVPEVTRADLAEIRATALGALTEMRRVLGVLRSEGPAETAPQPGLDGLDALLDGARGTGLAIDAETSGDLAGLPPGVGLSAFRIVQEALSNAMRHAPGSHVRVAAARRGGILHLEIVNGPPPAGQRPTPSPPGGGHGLTGMRERAAMLGGDLAAGPTPEGGFQVTARLPVADPA